MDDLAGLLREWLRLSLLLIAMEALSVLVTGDFITGEPSGFWDGLL